MTEQWGHAKSEHALKILAARLIEDHGLSAPEQAERLAEWACEQDDADGVLMWRAVLERVDELLAKPQEPLN